METAKVVAPQHEDNNLFEDGRFSRSELLEQLERIVRSKHFRNSKRYPTFLRFVVEQTLAGKTEGLKERTLGVDVFARPSHYDTNEDPIVRVTAGEIRKRIAQYYQEPGHGEELRIDLPLGSYVPHFPFRSRSMTIFDVPSMHRTPRQQWPNTKWLDRKRLCWRRSNQLPGYGVGKRSYF
jgi:hypothetical protein